MMLINILMFSEILCSRFFVSTTLKYRSTLNAIMVNELTIMPMKSIKNMRRHPNRPGLKFSLSICTKNNGMPSVYTKSLSAKFNMNKLICLKFFIIKIEIIVIKLRVILKNKLTTSRPNIINVIVSKEATSVENVASEKFIFTLDILPYSSNLISISFIALF